MRYFCIWILFFVCSSVTFAGESPAGVDAVTSEAIKTDTSLSVAVEPSWWDGSPWVKEDRGFVWYPPDAPKPKKPKPKIEAKPKAKSIKEMQTMEELQAELMRLKNVAIMQPTEKNVHEYLKAQTFVMDKGALFADTARRVVWANPDVDYNNRSPVANIALLEKKDMRRAAQQKNMRDLAQDYGLMFFFKGDCAYCHLQAPILKVLEQNYGMPILPVSLDGSSINEFPNALRDNGISIKVSNGEGITVTPTLYLVHRQSKQAVAIGTGALAMDEIIERIRVLTSTKPGQEF